MNPFSKWLTALTATLCATLGWGAELVVDWYNFGTQVIPGQASTSDGGISLSELGSGVTTDNGAIVIGSSATAGITLTVSPALEKLSIEMLYSLDEGASATGGLINYVDNGSHTMGVERRDIDGVNKLAL